MAFTAVDIKEIRRLARLEAHAYAQATGNPLYPVARTSFNTTTGRVAAPASAGLNTAFDDVDAANGGNPFA